MSPNVLHSSEYAENGSLFSYLHEKKLVPSKDQCLRWIRQIAEGIKGRVAISVPYSKVSIVK